ncbi:MAG: hypothetical protein Q8P02_03355, partial [Candidatus Micrarchaeota archaeon]|nr:hypothetical protein [Candidatus Micrarchaeota archaeon]
PAVQEPPAPAPTESGSDSGSGDAHDDSGSSDSSGSGSDGGASDGSSGSSDSSSSGESVQTAASPFTGFVTGPSTPRQMCENEWRRNADRFNQDCQRMKQNGPQFNVCDKDAFIAQCKSENQQRMQKEQSGVNLDRICELQSKRDIRNLERYCLDIGRGKEQCLKETERGCEFGKKQLARCQELTSPDNVRAAIEKAVARGCRERGPGGAGLRDLRNSLPSEFRGLIDFESDNVAEAQETVRNVDQKDFGYALTALLGLQAEQEKKDAEALQQQTERLSSTIDRLKQLAEQVDDASARAVLEAQIIDLEGQRDDLSAKAKGKQDGAAGIFSFLSGLFGGK